MRGGARVVWGAATHAGRVRTVNQDAVLAGPRIFAVADGMGGHTAGDVASSLAVAVLARASGGDDGLTADDVLLAVHRANGRILSESSSEDRAGMGTTLALLAVVEPASTGGDDLVVANVGDSRVYRLDPGTGQLEQLSIDHSVVSELVAAGEISEDAARTHPERHAITRALGLYPDIDIDHWTRRAVAGERFVVCSDGLVREVDRDEIAALLGQQRPASATAEQLLQVALDRGAEDNVSVVVVDVVDRAPGDDVGRGGRPGQNEDTVPRGGRGA